MPKFNLFARAFLTPEGKKTIIKYKIGSGEGYIELNSDIKLFDRFRKEKLRKLLNAIEPFVYEMTYEILLKQ